MPDWAVDKKKRAERIRAAQAELEAEAKAAAAAKAKALAKAEDERRTQGRRKPGKPAAPPSDKPDPKAQKNFTDPESRIMKTKDGSFKYNAQAAVDATAQVIVPYGLDARQSDQHHLTPIADAIEADANIAALEERGAVYIAPGRAKTCERGRRRWRASPPARENQGRGHDTAPIA